MQTLKLIAATISVVIGYSLVLLLCPPLFIALLYMEWRAYKYGG